MFDKVGKLGNNLSSDVKSMGMGNDDVRTVTTPAKKSQCDKYTDNTTELNRSKSEIRCILNHIALLEKAEKVVRQ